VNEVQDLVPMQDFNTHALIEKYSIKKDPIRLPIILPINGQLLPNLHLDQNHGIKCLAKEI
jgi:hypothetical protein